MTKTELLESIRNGENSFVEFKRDDIDNQKLARELVAFSNLEGGRAARNQLLKDVMRDYGYMEHMGMGIPRKIIEPMKEQVGTTPELTVGQEDFSLVPRRSPRHRDGPEMAKHLQPQRKDFPDLPIPNPGACGQGTKGVAILGQLPCNLTAARQCRSIIEEKRFWFGINTSFHLHKPPRRQEDPWKGLYIHR
uniref:ATP-dependent DNA helicase recG C-terminal n=1 Tax=Candidatus Kentrum sp. LFY TaxID=2126342 RepID=A0A450UDI1_9GAMM|nr:MAG: Putative ATP-dependent DNA helicase recG C-terminal [Candidatus Kentron sp. LFY]